MQHRLQTIQDIDAIGAIHMVTDGDTLIALEFGDIAMDLSAHRARRARRQVQLGPTEFRLLEHFLRHPRRVFSREALLDAVWGRDIHVEPRTVDVHIRRLRQALVAPRETDPIRTVRSAGYALDGER